MQYLRSHPYTLPRAPPGDRKLEPNLRTLSSAAIGKWLADDPLVDFLRDTAEFGAWLPYESTVSGWPRGSFANRVPESHMAEVDRQIREEVKLGWLKTRPEVASAGIWANAPIQVSVEPTKIRRVVDYSNRNGNAYLGFNGLTRKEWLPEPTMASTRHLAAAVQVLKKAAGGNPPLLLVRDVSKAYRRFVVRPDQWETLRMVWGGEEIFDSRLPFGHAASAAYCCAMTTAIARQLSWRMWGKAIFLAYVDDFVVVAHPAHTKEAGRLLHQCLTDIGLPISTSKKEEAGGWSTTATWIGFSHNTVTETHSLTSRRLMSLLDQLKEAEEAPRNIEKWQKLIGGLAHVCTVFHAAKPQLRPLYNHMSAILTKRGETPPRAVFHWWRNALQAMGRMAPMFRPPTRGDLAIVTDASLTAGGWALYTNRDSALRVSMESDLVATMSFRFRSAHTAGDMTLLEAHAVLRAVQVCAPMIKNKSVWVAVDNMALEYALRKGRSKSPRVNAVIARILLHALRFGFRIFPLRIPSAQNVLADRLSRTQEGSLDATLTKLQATGRFKWGHAMVVPSGASLPKWRSF